MALEDFTTFTEHDVVGDYLSVAANKIDITSLSSIEKYGVVKDYESNHFGDFEHLLEYYIDSAQNSSRPSVFIITNQDTYYLAACQAADDGLWFGMSRNNVGAQDFQIRCESTNETDISVQWLVDTLYFIKFKRVGTTLTADIYTGSHGGTPVGSLSITCESGAKRYLIAAGSHGGGTYWDGDCVAYIQNLDLQELVMPTQSLRISREFQVGGM